MKEILEHIESLKKAFARLHPLSAENQRRLDEKFRLEWNYNSNHIEGNTLSFGETKLLLIFDLTKGNHELREYEEMKGHDVALKLIYDLAADSERQLTEKFIREINEILLVRPFYKEAITPDRQQTRRKIKIGDYKESPNSVLLMNGEMFHYPSPSEIPALMNDLMNWYNTASKDKDQSPVEVAAELHYRFVFIHPFDDGNGRMARLLMNYHLIKSGYPPIIIKSIDKDKYLFALREADAGNIEAFKNYITEQLVWSYEISIKAAKGESIDEAGDWEKKIEILKKETAKNPEIKKEKSLETTIEILKKSISPLIEELLQKIKALEQFYQKSDIYITYDNKAPITNQHHEVVFNMLYSLDEDIRSLDFSQVLRNFKRNNINTFDTAYKLNFYFSDLTYSITIQTVNPEFSLKKINSEYLTKPEIDSIVSKITENSLAQVYRMLNQI